MAITKEKKQEIVKELRDKLAKSKSVVFIRNDGITVADITKLKKELRAQQVEIKVAKKTLIEKVWKDLQFPTLPQNVLEGPVALVMAYENEMSGAKLLKTFMKENEKVSFSGGVFEGKLYDKAGVATIASLPSKEELMAKLLGSLQSPLYGFHHALQYHLRGLVVVLSTLAKKKQTV